MKEIKAFVHRGRIVDIIRALADAGFAYPSVSDVQGTLLALTEREQMYSVKLGKRVTGRSRSKCSAKTIRPNEWCN